MATSKRTLRIELSPDFRGAVRALPKQRRFQIGRAITMVRDGFGDPHLHAGIGIRRLRDSIFECQVGLKLRLVFECERDLVTFTAVGTYDEICKLLRSR